MPPKIKNLKKKPLVQHKKRPLKQVKKEQQLQQPQAERRDSSYGAPAPPKRQVIIKQAGNHLNSTKICDKHRSKSIRVTKLYKKCQT